jgi:hypothetical protein
VEGSIIIAGDVQNSKKPLGKTLTGIGSALVIGGVGPFGRRAVPAGLDWKQTSVYSQPPEGQED